MGKRKWWIVNIAAMALCVAAFLIFINLNSGERLVMLGGVSLAVMCCVFVVIFSLALASLPMIVMLSMKKREKKTWIAVGVLTAIAAAAAFFVLLLGIWISDVNSIELVTSPDGQYVIADEFREGWLGGGTHAYYIRTGGMTYERVMYGNDALFDWQEDRLVIIDENGNGKEEEVMYSEFYGDK